LLIDRFGFPHLLATTLVLVAATILLGVAAKATGSGLACEANWPQCDAGPWNLFPANIPSFYEWIHRFVAMFAGVAIIGSALSAWRTPTVDSRVATLVVLGMILTPIQVYLGRETVLAYDLEILSLHFWTAVLIFALFVVATLLVWQASLTKGHILGALGLGVLALPVQLLLSPFILEAITNSVAFLDLTYSSPTVQMTHYASSLAIVGSVIAAGTVGRWKLEDGRLLGLLAGTGLVAFVVVFLGRQTTMTVNTTLESLYFGTAVVLLIAFSVSLWAVRNAAEPRSRRL